MKNNTSGYRGVSWHSRDKVWIATVRTPDRLINVGSFQTAKAAGKAAEKKRQELNFLTGTTR